MGAYFVPKQGFSNDVCRLAQEPVVSMPYSLFTAFLMDRKPVNLQTRLSETIVKY